jgi:imidazolonepropionase-like amidohydrolase
VVGAHAIGPEGIVRAIRAGVDSIEHGSMLSAEGARLMKERGTFHVPTISAIRGIVDHAQEVPAYAVEKATALVELARDGFRRSLRTGVRIACGTDAGTPFNPHGNTLVEIVRMVEWGLSPLQAMRSATSNAAALLRLPDVGVVEQGAAAGPRPVRVEPARGDPGRARAGARDQGRRARRRLDALRSACRSSPEVLSLPVPRLIGTRRSG